MPKATCLKCSNTATIAMLCGKCYRNSQTEVPVAHRPEPRVTKIPTAAGPAVSYETPPAGVQQTRCEAPGCETFVSQQPTGRRKRFCSARCRVRFNAAKD